jgi:elongation factor Ts
LEQPFVKDANKSIEQLLNECSAKIGERLVVRRFMRFVLGEGIERAEEDFAKEVEKVASST